MATKTTSKKKTSSRKTASTKASSRAKSPSQEMIEPVLKRAKSAGWMAILESVVIGILGALLILNPEGDRKSVV